MPAKRFEHILHDLGMAGLEHPLFWHAPVQFYRDLSGIAFSRSGFCGRSFWGILEAGEDLCPASI